MFHTTNTKPTTINFKINLCCFVFVVALCEVNNQYSIL